MSQTAIEASRIVRNIITNPTVQKIIQSNFVQTAGKVSISVMTFFYNHCPVFSLSLLFIERTFTNHSSEKPLTHKLIIDLRNSILAIGSYQILSSSFIKTMYVSLHILLKGSLVLSSVVLQSILTYKIIKIGPTQIKKLIDVIKALFTSERPIATHHKQRKPTPSMSPPIMTDLDPGMLPPPSRGKTGGNKTAIPLISPRPEKATSPLPSPVEHSDSEESVPTEEANSELSSSDEEPAKGRSTLTSSRSSTLHQKRPAKPFSSRKPLQQQSKRLRQPLTAGRVLVSLQQRPPFTTSASARSISAPRRKQLADKAKDKSSEEEPKKPSVKTRKKRPLPNGHTFVSARSISAPRSKQLADKAKDKSRKEESKTPSIGIKKERALPNGRTSGSARSISAPRRKPVIKAPSVRRRKEKPPTYARTSGSTKATAGADRIIVGRIRSFNVLCNQAKIPLKNKRACELHVELFAEAATKVQNIILQLASLPRSRKIRKAKEALIGLQSKCEKTGKLANLSDTESLKIQEEFLAAVETLQDAIVTKLRSET